VDEAEELLAAFLNKDAPGKLEVEGLAMSSRSDDDPTSLPSLFLAEKLSALIDGLDPGCSFDGVIGLVVPPVSAPSCGAMGRIGGKEGVLLQRGDRVDLPNVHVEIFIKVSFQHRELVKR
jgi:hypothetical protein